MTLPLFGPPSGKPYGWQDPKEWNAFARWMRDNELLENVVDARGAYTNEYLPGAGPRPPPLTWRCDSSDAATRPTAAGEGQRDAVKKP